MTPCRYEADVLASVTAGSWDHAPEELKAAHALQRKAQWRIDFVNAENSLGFHAPQETARILGEAIDYARQGQISVLRQKGK